MPLKKKLRRNLSVSFAALVFAALAIYYVHEHIPTEDRPVTSWIGGCPDGGRLLGATPPDGTERGCQIQDKDGNSIRHGAWTEWYMNGAKHKEGSYIQGRRAGKWTWFYPNGNKMQEGKFWDGAPVGTWSFWDENGKDSDGPAKEDAAGAGAGSNTPDLDDFAKNMKKGF